MTEVKTRRNGMNPAQYFVVQSGSEWKIKFRNELFGPYRSRDEALLFAIDAAQEIGRRESGATVLVEDVKDRYLTRWTYGERPHLPVLDGATRDRSCDDQKSRPSAVKHGTRTPDQVLFP
jgi:hypothetical protein